MTVDAPETTAPKQDAAGASNEREKSSIPEEETDQKPSETAKDPPAAETAQEAGSPVTSTKEDDKAKKQPLDDSDEKETKETEPPPKKAKIAMPPAVSALQLNVEKYTLDAQPASDANKDATTKIATPGLMVFGLHPLVKEDPLKKLCEDFGSPIQSFGVRSAFASRYCHLEYESVQQAQAAYTALNGAKLFQKALLVQPAPVSKPAS